MKNTVTPRDWEALSAYLDEEISLKERLRLEARIKSDPALGAALEELRRTRVVLRSQPRQQAPRNFTLTPQMAGIKQGRPPVPRFYTKLRLASALATVFFLIVLVGDLVGTRAKPAEVSQAPGASVPGPAIGKGGGGGGGSAESGVQNITPPEQPVAPTEEAFSAKSAESGTQTPVLEVTPVLEATSAGPTPTVTPTPPVVGMAPMVRATEAPLETVAPAADQAQTAPTRETAPAQVIGLPVLQVLLVLLGLIAVITGLAAVILRMRGS